MRAIAFVPNGHIEEDEAYGFRLQAAHIFETWTKLILQAGVKSSRWIISDDGLMLSLSDC